MMWLLGCRSRGCGRVSLVQDAAPALSSASATPSHAQVKERIAGREARAREEGEVEEERRAMGVAVMMMMKLMIIERKTDNGSREENILRR